ncbi:MAG: DUF4920 domain-containing protein [Myxococcales bacterium]|nr:DUF4920 domain-containing protein [Myxococcales bacterium]
MRLAFLLVVACSVAACSRERESVPSAGATPGSQPAAAQPSGSAAPAAPKGVLVLGERITSPIVPLADIARAPARFENQTIATTGKVTAVCQAMGCWMEIQDTSGLAHVRMHGHTFFVPKTASGHLARVQARVLPSNTEECLDSPAPKAEVAKIELDATGVELD